MEEPFFLSCGQRDPYKKHIGQAIPTYAMGVFCLPKVCCDDLMRMCARFWWGSSAEKRKIQWLRWEKLCWPKELGGSNFQDLEGFNQALLAKVLEVGRAEGCGVWLEDIWEA